MLRGARVPAHAGDAKAIVMMTPIAVGACGVINGQHRRTWFRDAPLPDTHHRHHLPIKIMIIATVRDVAFELTHAHPRTNKKQALNDS